MLLFCFVLFCFVLFCFVLFCFVLFCFVLFCFVLFCFVLFCFVLFCFVSNFRYSSMEFIILTPTISMRPTRVKSYSMSEIMLGVPRS